MLSTRSVVTAALAVPLATAAVALEVNVGDAGSQISPGLFGHNLEFTRHDLFAGLSAQLVANRQFVVMPEKTSWPFAWDTPGVFPPRWTPIGTPTVERPGFAGPTSSAIKCAEGFACGVSQTTVAEGFDSGKGGGSAIPLQAGVTYTARITARAAIAKEALKLDLALSQSLSMEFSVPSDGQWHTIEIDGIAQLSSEGATLSLQGTGGTFWIGAVSLMQVDNFHGMRPDVIAKMKQIGFRGPLRFPGGCFAPFYKWRESLLPPDARPPMLTPPDYCTAVAGGVNAYTEGAVENGLSTDEFIALCNELGMAPEITLALQFGTDAEIQDARDWSEYCNGGPDTEMGALRASRGHKEPFNVELWTLGNEMNQQRRYRNYPNDTSHVSPPSGAEYASIVSQAANALASNPPKQGSLQLFFIGDGSASWDTPTVAALPHDITYYVSYHNGYHTQGSLSQPSDFTKAAKFGATGWLISGMRNLRRGIDAEAKAAGFNQTFGISADEWGLGDPWSVKGFGTVHAMYGAALMGSVIRNAENLSVAFTNYFEVINEGGITVHPFTAELTPVGEALALYAAHQNCAQIPVTPAFEEGGDLDVVASLVNGGEPRLQLTFANLNAEASHDFSVSLTSAVASSAAATLLTAETPLTPLSGFRRTTHDIPVKDGAFSLSLPPFAISHVTVTVSSAYGKSAFVTV